MAVKEVGSAVPSPAKKVGGVRLVDQVVRGLQRTGHNAQSGAGLFGISAPDFSKAFSVNWPERNALMKKFDDLPFESRREIVALLAADYEISAPDSEQTRVLRDFARLVKEIA